MRNANYLPFIAFYEQYLEELVEFTAQILLGHLSLKETELDWRRPSFTNLQKFLSKGSKSRYLKLDEIIGFICFSQQYEMLELHNIKVNSIYRKQGYGQLLLDLFLTFGELKQATNYLLEVRRSNTPAIYLYEKNGFKYLSTRHNYYSNSLNGFAEDALIYQILKED
ncbi:hypothetical protein CKF54_03845 [Psittacicella hinzii]|uniref:N-acetyltransferase domain-containing protein n=2 Tax=Psittacicella hinzii TaxID=2028575 RepID=A0A3A1Y6P3_9GAMM|nr:hypothetical protein CKF54_03845 [Psittacicella hinzii]